jgi:multidrug efflux pump subunit AcrA (membrane-fusion protein)
MKLVLLAGAVACLVFAVPREADAKDKAQATAGQPQQSMATTQRRATTPKSSFRGDRTSVLPSANPDYCPGQY